MRWRALEIMAGGLAVLAVLALAVGLVVPALIEHIRERR